MSKEKNVSYPIYSDEGHVHDWFLFERTLRWPTLEEREEGAGDDRGYGELWYCKICRLVEERFASIGRWR